MHYTILFKHKVMHFKVLNVKKRLAGSVDWFHAAGLSNPALAVVRKSKYNNLDGNHAHFFFTALARLQ